MHDPTLEAARRVKALAREAASRSAEVTGVGIARVDGAYAVKVNLRNTPPADLPRQIDGVPVLYERTGALRIRGGI
jgi:hypothetical protein